MRASLLAFALAAAASFPACAADPPDPPEPLKTLCERICGGVWHQAEDEPQASDGFYTSYAYVWDEALSAIKGTVATVGGVAGTTEERIVIYGLNHRTGKIWSVTVNGRVNPVYGEIDVSSDGYIAELRPLGGDGSSMTVVTVFEGANRFTQTATITHDGGRTVATPRSYVRTPE